MRGFSDGTHERKDSGACPNIQIGGMPELSSVEHLVTLKTWMLMKEEGQDNGIFRPLTWRNSLIKGACWTPCTHCKLRLRFETIGSGIN